MKYDTVGIGEVVRQCNVTEKQLRYWQEAGYINPDKVICGERTYRQYGESDVALITEIKRLLDKGFTLANAVRIARKNIEGKK